jgi:hypothetical protein
MTERVQCGGFVKENLDGTYVGMFADRAITRSADARRVLSRDLSQDEAVLCALFAELAAQGSY